MNEMFENPFECISLFSEDMDKQFTHVQKLNLRRSFSPPITNEERAKISKEMSEHYPKFDQLIGTLQNNLKQDTTEQTFQALKQYRDLDVSPKNIAKMLPDFELSKIDLDSNSEDKQRYSSARNIGFHIDIMNQPKVIDTIVKFRKAGMNDDVLASAIKSRIEFHKNGFHKNAFSQVAEQSKFPESKLTQTLVNQEVTKGIINMLDSGYSNDQIINMVKNKDKNLSEGLEKLVNGKLKPANLYKSQDLSLEDYFSTQPELEPLPNLFPELDSESIKKTSSARSI
jgi:hypothetical protein